MGPARTLAVAAALAAVLAVAGCGDSEDDADDGSSTVTAEDLADTVFTSTDVNGHELVAGSTVSLTFADDSLSVNAGCNTQGAAYEVADGTLTWTGEPQATMMACEDALMAQDDWLRTFFTDGVDVALDGTTLTLTQADVTMELQQEG